MYARTGRGISILIYFQKSGQRRPRPESFSTTTGRLSPESLGFNVVRCTPKFLLPPGEDGNLQVRRWKRKIKRALFPILSQGWSHDGWFSDARKFFLGQKNEVVGRTNGTRGGSVAVSFSTNFLCESVQTRGSRRMIYSRFFDARVFTHIDPNKPPMLPSPLPRLSIPPSHRWCRRRVVNRRLVTTRTTRLASWVW